MHSVSTLFLAVALATAPGTHGAPAPAPQAPGIRNGGFETVRKTVPPKAHPRFHRWVLETGSAPVDWTLNRSFPGRLAVVETTAPEGRRFLRIKAFPKRAAHLFQAVPDIVPGRIFRMSLRYRRGPVVLEIYEYDAKGRLVAERTVAEGPAVIGDAWHEISGLYRPIDITKAAVAVTVAGGAQADIDDVRCTIYTLDARTDALGRFNVKDFGASGSRFETTAAVQTGEKDITLAQAGDFQPGQGIAVEGARVHYDDCRIWGPEGTYGTARPWNNEVEVRGFEGTAGPWVFYLVEIDGKDPLTFRWKDDLSRDYKASHVPVTHDWQRLSNGVEIRLSRAFDWRPGHLITFNARNTLTTTVTAVAGVRVALADAPNRTLAEARVFHEDTKALQALFRDASLVGGHVFFPNGLYRLTAPLTIRNAKSLTVEGASGEETVLDISMGVGELAHAGGATPAAACFLIDGGKRITIRNFRMLGHTGLRDRARNIRTVTGGFIWGFQLRPCRAVGIVGGAGHVLIENCHARRMASECFYSQTRGRGGQADADSHSTKSITYLRCSVEDCGFNAFNNNDTADNTSVLYCRIVDVGNCAWEGPARYIRFIGNYVRNGGVCTIGNMSTRVPFLNDLGCGQAVFADNVFEGTAPLGTWINICHAATQVVVRNNLFVNSGGHAIRVLGRSATMQAGRSYFPARNVLVDGNIMDLTAPAPDGGGRPRFGIDVGASDVTVCNNQIYTRAKPDPLLTAIRVREPAVNINVHDNLIRNCGRGLVTDRTVGYVHKVLDKRTFSVGSGDLPLPWRYSHCYRGWTAVWTGEIPFARSTVETFDADSLFFHLAAPREIRKGDRLELCSPKGLNWRFHHNIITDCIQPAVLDSYGGNAVVESNTISRGQVTGVTNAVVVAGRFDLIGNRISGFDEPGSAALLLRRDRLGRTCDNIIQDNVIDHADLAVREETKGLWDACRTRDNLFRDCAGDVAPAAPASNAAAGKPRLVAPSAPRDFALDGKVDEWPWKTRGRSVLIERTPEGARVPNFTCRAMAAYSGGCLLIAVRCPLIGGKPLKPALDWGGDGVEIAFQVADSATPRPIFVFWGAADGRFQASDCGGVPRARIDGIEKTTGFKTHVGRQEWTCEWRIPLADAGIEPVRGTVLFANIGVRSMAAGCWVSWVPTGGANWHVRSAGRLVFE